MIIALFLLSKYYLFLHLFWEEEKEEAGGNDRVVVFATKPAGSTSRKCDRQSIQV